MTDATAFNAGNATFSNVASALNTPSPVPASVAPGVTGVVPEVDSSVGKVDRVSQLLGGLREIAVEQQPLDQENSFKYENRLAVVRLGMATSLFFALRAKHAPTASHSLRVALACSAWAERLGLSSLERDRIEVAALLHDVGKIGVPDRILRKPGKLTVEEQLVMDSCAEAGCDIVRGCSSDNELLDIICYSGIWYNSRRFGDSIRGEAIPLGARLLAIANAYDSMTTEHVYRRALSRDLAVEQLLDGGGTQFDPELAHDYSRFIVQNPEMQQAMVLNRWLQQLSPESSTEFWTSTAKPESRESGCASNTDRRRAERRSGDSIFYRQMLSQMHDGIAFTDSQATIMHWNTALEQITKITSEGVIGKTWNCSSLKMFSNDAGHASSDCPVQACLRTQSPQLRTMTVKADGGRSAPIQIRVSPVVGDVPGTVGTIIFVRDLSDQTSMQQRLETLHLQVTRDALTGIANRAEFDRRITELTETAASGGSTFSLIICDIDHFKRVNDVHGHPAGDEALVKFASVLSGFSRDEDLVARYGGEEFVFLAVGCDNATSAKRAEAIRAELGKTPLPSLGNASVTASFGVTQYQAGDSAETILARADRALLRAKDNGRNRVVRLGAGSQTAGEATAKRSWLSWFDSSDRRPDREVDILTPVPMDLAIEKLKGFIADHEAEILTVAENQVSLRVNAICTIGGRRRIDQQIALNALLTLSEAKPDLESRKRGAGLNTKIHVQLKPVRNRDRRSRELAVCSDQVIASLRSYLMGEIIEEGDVE